METLFILWLCTILASIAFSFTPLISLLKEVGDNGYKVNIDKFDDIIDIFDENEEKANELMTILLFLIPIINIIFSLIEAYEHISNKSELIESLRCSDVFEEMTEKEKKEYQRTKKLRFVLTSQKTDLKVNNQLLKYSLKLLGFTNDTKENNEYFCINSKLKNKDKHNNTKIVYTDEELNITDEDTKLYTNALVNLNENNFKINIGYFIQNHKAYKVCKKNPYKIKSYIDSIKLVFEKYDNDQLESAKEENIFPIIKNNIISVSTDSNEDIIVNSDIFFEELYKLGYNIEYDNLDFNKLINKLLLNEDLGLDIKLTKNNNDKILTKK